MKKNKTKILMKHDQSQIKIKKTIHPIYKAPVKYDVTKNKCGLRICVPFGIDEYLTSREYIHLRYECGCTLFSGNTRRIKFKNPDRKMISLKDIMYSIDKNTRTKFK
jgi:hypothetical protein